MMRKRVKLDDIAKVVGISKMAVSLAIRGDRSVSEETAKKVRKVAQELGYVPNRMAQGLVKGKSNTIALLISAPLHDDYQNKIISGAVPYAMKRGYTIFVGPMSHSDLEQSYIHKYKNMMVDGFLAFHAVNGGSANFRQLQEEKFPFVLYTKYFMDMDSDYVVCNDVKGGHLMTRHLIELGHTRIGFVYDVRLQRSSEIVNRKKGFSQALRESGLPDGEELFIPFELHYHAADMSTEQLLERNPVFAERMRADNRPTALFVSNDIAASSVYIALKQLGLKIPEDVSVGGYEGVYLGSVLDPSLTTVATPIQELGMKACKLLIDKIEGDIPDSETVHIQLDPKLIVRASTRAL